MKRALVSAAALFLIPILAAGPAGTQSSASEKRPRTTVGSDLKPEPKAGYNCGRERSCSILPVVAGKGDIAKAPFDGVIHRWRFRRGDDSGSKTFRIRLRVVRPLGAGRFRFLGPGSKKTVTRPPGIKTFRSRLRIRRGDYIALDLLKGQVRGFVGAGDGAAQRKYRPAPDSDRDVGNGVRTTGFEPLFNATVRRER